MAEENQQKVTTKDPKEVEAGKRLAVHNRKKGEELKAQKSEVSQYYSIGALPAVGVIGGLGYYIYQSKKGEVEQHYRDLAFITLSMIGIGGVLYYFES